MYESFYGLKEKPFTLLPDPEYLYLSPKHQRALTLLEYGMMNHAGFSVICGDTGAGKTTLIRRLLTELGDDTCVGLITNTHQSFGELLNWVLMAFGLEGEGKSKAQMHHIFIDFLIEQYAQNKHAVLIVDEAQNMSADTLEELRMLSNINADKDQILQVILAGQPALRETLRRPELMQFAQRIAVDYYLESLSAEETKAYIHHRLKVAGAEQVIFTDDACNAIYKYSAGTPRLINLLCDTALVYGYAEQSEVISVQLVHDVVREQHSNSIIPTFNTSQPHRVDDLPQPPHATIPSEPVMSVAENPAVDYVLEQSEAELKKAEQKQFESAPVKAEEESDEVIAELAQRAVKAVANADQSNKLVNAQSTSVSQVVTSHSAAPSANTGIEETADSSNVTSINARHNDPVVENQETEELKSINTKVETGTETGEQQVQNANLESTDDRVEKDSLVKAQIEEQVVEQTLAGAAINEDRRHDDADVYPIVHVEESSKKGLGIVIAGMVAGMFIASIVMGGVAWMFLNSNGKNLFESVQRVSVNEELEKNNNLREIEIMQKERDAALAVSRALERERDAALSAAKIQEEIRAVELRATEILAEQESRAEKRLRDAQSRAREAERSEAKAIKRERALKRKTEEAKLAELEAKRLRLKKEAQLRADLKAMQALQGKPEEVVKQVELKEVAVIEKPAEPKKEKSKSFSANPCNSPSAKFLSTCKK